MEKRAKKIQLKTKKYIWAGLTIPLRIDEPGDEFILAIFNT